MAAYTFDPVSAINAANSSAQSYALSSADRANAWSAEQAAITRDFNSREAAKNRDWQEYMSNTAHQREVQDLLAAGLNPVLSATGGNGASVGSGSSASASVPSAQKAEAQNASSAIASILGQVLAAQTAQTNAILSAETQRAIAEKQTASAQLVAGINSAASKYVSDKSAEASRYSADKSAEASRYSADKAAEHSWPGVIVDALSGFFGYERGTGAYSLGKDIRSMFNPKHITESLSEEDKDKVDKVVDVINSVLNINPLNKGDSGLTEADMLKILKEIGFPGY